jgi:hypothetical protein
MSDLDGIILNPNPKGLKPVEYRFVITTHYDGDYRSSHRYPDALTAVEAFSRCVDWGTAREYATYNLLEPSGKMHTKTFYKSGKVTGK